MTSAENLVKGIERANRDWLEQKFEPALRQVQDLLVRWPDHPRLLLMRAALIQLQDDEGGTPTLKDARRDLLRAVELDKDSPAANLDLAYFLHAVENDSRGALKYFKATIRLCKSILRDALIGQAEALAELEEDAKAEACLMEALELDYEDGKTESREILERLISLQRPSPQQT